MGFVERTKQITTQQEVWDSLWHSIRHTLRNSVNGMDRKSFYLIPYNERIRVQKHMEKRFRDVDECYRKKTVHSNR